MLCKVLFDNYIKSLPESKIKNILLNEKNNLKKFGEALLKLSKEIVSEQTDTSNFFPVSGWYKKKLIWGEALTRVMLFQQQYFD